MGMLVNVILTVQILTALGMIGLILIQHGKGADMGAAFGSGSSGSLFGASGSANFLSRTTAVLAVIFFVSTLVPPAPAVCSKARRPLPCPWRLRLRRVPLQPFQAMQRLRQPRVPHQRLPLRVQGRFLRSDG